MKEFIHGDCMEGMKDFPNNFFDLAIVDPPFGIGAENHAGNKKNGWNQWEKKEWDKSMPTKEYFDELKRISKNQIIWGGNYFANMLSNSQCWLVWDKGQRDFSLADGEMAWTSFDKAMRIFSYARGKANQEIKHHPTQKPVQLYKWLLRNYATRDMKIIDTHVGSGSSIIAFEDFGCEYIGFEIDKDYFEAATKRINQHKSQLVLL